jgi:hypothetical protein
VAIYFPYWLVQLMEIWIPLLFAASIYGQGIYFPLSSNFLAIFIYWWKLALIKWLAERMTSNADKMSTKLLSFFTSWDRFSVLHPVWLSICSLSLCLCIVEKGKGCIRKARKNNPSNQIPIAGDTTTGLRLGWLLLISADVSPPPPLS